MRTRLAIAVLAVGLSGSMLDGCTEPGWKPSFTPVDSGGGTAIPGLLAELELSYSEFRQPRLSWTSDGAALRVASAGPGAFSQSTLWSVNPTTRVVTTLVTIQTTDPFYGVSCYVETTDCDLVRYSSRVTRRAATGDTATIIPTTLNGHFVSENGRYFVYAESDAKLRLLDATTGAKTTLTIPNVTAFAQVLAISNDGGEVDVVVSGGLSVTRYKVSDGSSTTWAVPAESGMAGSILALQWVGPTLYALVRWSTPTEIRFTQYPITGGTSFTLGTVPRAKGTGLWNWRPQAQRMVLEVVSAYDYNPDIIDGPVGVRQFELEYLHNGVATRVARSGFGWLNMSLSPDGRTMASGSHSLFLQYLPE